MNRFLVRTMVVAAATAVCLIGSDTWLSRLTAPLQAQQSGDRMPGPIIVDPPGPYAGHSYVPDSSKGAGPTEFVSNWQITYNGFSPQAQAAFQAAVNVWASQIQSAVPIQVTANWVPLASNVLGSAGATYVIRDFQGAPIPNTYYPAALANKLAGFDLVTTGTPGPHDITANFNSNFNWYYGTDGNAGSNYDLKTVVLHELGHGLGFFGSMSASGVPPTGSWGFTSSIGLLPSVYDWFAVNGSAQLLINTALFPNPSTALGAQLTSNNVFFDGPVAKGANGGARPKLYAPATWTAGSSFSHLDESTYTAGNINSLMTPQLGAGEAIHDTGPITRGLFADTGWGSVLSCLYSLSAGSTSIGGGGGSGSVNVIAGAGCAWNAVSNSGFITINSGSGSGSGPVTFTVAANTGGPRSGTITIVGHTFTVNQNAALTRPGDFNGDGVSDVAVFRPSTGVWYIRGVSTTTWGGGGDIPVAGDYDGDGKTDVAVFRPSTGVWYVLQSSTASGTVTTWGGGADIPVPGDYDGDGKTDFAVFRPSTGVWYVLRSSTASGTVTTWGGGADIPAPGDYDGDGKTDVAVFRPSTGVWFLLLSSTSSGSVSTWGGGGDIPVSADYDGDGKADIAVFRPSSGVWFVLRSATSSGSVTNWGGGGDIPVPADYDGDGKSDVAVFRPSTGNWFIITSSNGGGVVINWGGGGDIPVLKRP